MGWDLVASLAYRKPLRVTEYTSGAGTHSMHPDSTYQVIVLVGGGGGGGGRYTAAGSSARGAGGGVGGDELYRRVILSGSVAYEVGAAGAAGANNSTTAGLDGGSGGRTVLHLYEASGGAGGVGTPASGTATKRTRSVATDGWTTPGKVGGAVRSGGDSTYGVGSVASGSGAATAASGYGAGGSGAYGNNLAASVDATAGTGGFLRIEEY